jgi:predicted AAA+ superfamily ATPase
LARTIFLGSAPDSANLTVAKRNKGLDQEHVFLGCAQPGQVTGHFRDGLRALTDELQYLSNANGRYWFDTRPNLLREMEERKRRFQDKEDVYPVIRERLQRVLGHGVFDGVHVFTTSSDIPDDGYLRLVVLSPEASMSRTGQNLAEGRAAEILKSRGDQPRQKQNRLIFLAADSDSIGRLKDQARAMLAWQSIVDDVKDMKLNVDQFQARQSGKSLEESNETLKRMVCEVFKWLLAPMQEARPGQGISEIKWEKFPLNSSSGALSNEIERVMKDNELLILEWAPIHLANLLKAWFWKDGVKEAGAIDVWQKMSCYLYFPRLKNEDVYRGAIAAGALSRDFFGIAYGKNGDKYDGFSLGRSAIITMDNALLLIEHSTAVAYDGVIKAAQQEAEEQAQQPTGFTPAAPQGAAAPVVGKPGSVPGKAPAKKRFYGCVNLDKVKHKLDFNEIADEVIKPFASRSDVGLTISIEIRAESYVNDGFDENIQRVVKENSKTLKFRNAEFE